MNIQKTHEVKRYYDENVVNKINGFINTNQRVERAWITLTENVTKANRVLEIGCGIGDICWRINSHYQNAEVVGIDISQKSIEIANKLFGSDRISFREGALNADKEMGKFDLILLMDVFEHIETGDRQELYQSIKTLLNPQGKIFLSCPTPRHLDFLRKNHPGAIQPIDENITIEILLEFGKATNTSLLMYKEVSVWATGDYFHAILGSYGDWVSGSDSRNYGFIRRILNELSAVRISRRNTPAKKRKLVESRIGKYDNHHVVLP